LEEPRQNLGPKTPRVKDKPEWKPKDNFRVKKDFKPRREFEERKCVDRKGGESVKRFATQTEWVPQGAMDRRRKAWECMRCAWPADRKGDHKLRIVIAQSKSKREQQIFLRLRITRN